MLRQIAATRFVKVPEKIAVRAMSGTYGDGAGRGGGSGGSIRDAGGIFGKMEAAREGEYFLKKEKETMAYFREHLEEEIQHHKELMERSAIAMEESKRALAELTAQQAAQKGEQQQSKIRRM